MDSVTAAGCSGFRPAGWCWLPDLSDGAVSSNDEVSALRDACDGNVDRFAPAAVPRCRRFLFHCTRHLTCPHCEARMTAQTRSAQSRRGAARLSRWLGNKLRGWVPTVGEVAMQSPHLAVSAQRLDVPAAVCRAFRLKRISYLRSQLCNRN